MRLEPGERVVVRARTHPRALVRPAARFVVTALLVGLLLGRLARPDLPGLLTDLRPALEGLVWAAGVLAVVLGTVRPLLRWLTRSTLITTHRVVRRSGIGAADAAMPLASIAEVHRRRRGSGAADLHVRFQDPLRQVYWRLTDVPEAERFEQLLADLTRRSRAAAWPAPSSLGVAP